MEIQDGKLQITGNPGNSTGDSAQYTRSEPTLSDTTSPIYLIQVGYQVLQVLPGLDLSESTVMQIGANIRVFRFDVAPITTCASQAGLCDYLDENCFGGRER